MPVTATEGKRLSDLVKFHSHNEFAVGYMTEVVTANEAADTDYEIGDLVGIVTASGKAKLAASASVDGSQTIYGVVLENKSLVAGTDTPVNVLVRGAAILGDKALNATQVADYTLAQIKTDLAAFNPPILVGDQL